MRKTTGIVRKIDELGRIVLPKELRRSLDIQDRDSMEIYVQGNAIILRKNEPSCIFCDGTRNTGHYGISRKKYLRKLSQGSEAKDGGFIKPLAVFLKMRYTGKKAFQP